MKLFPTVNTLAVLIAVTALHVGEAAAQNVRSPQRCPEGRTADGTACINPALARVAREKAIFYANANVSQTGPARMPRNDSDPQLNDAALLSRLLLFWSRHSTFGP